MKKFLIITQAIYLLFTGVWFVFLLMSVMMFDGGVTPLASTLFGVIAMYPLVMLGCAIAAWILYHKGRRRAVVYVNVIPGVWVIGMAAVLVYGVI